MVRLDLAFQRCRVWTSGISTGSAVCGKLLLRLEVPHVGVSTLPYLKLFTWNGNVQVVVVVIDLTKQHREFVTMSEIGEFGEKQTVTYIFLPPVLES